MDGYSVPSFTHWNIDFLARGVISHYVNAGIARASQDSLEAAPFSLLFRFALV